MEKGDAGPSGPASEPGENDSKFLADARGAFIRSENARNRLLRDGAAILDAMEAAFTRYVVLPSGHALVAVVLFTAATHAQPAWEHAVRLIVKSAVKRSGKTRLLEILSELAHNVLRAATASVAALVRSIEEANPPTIVLDEADVIFRPRKGGERREGAEDLRGSLNAGFRRGWKYLRWDPVANCRVECETFAMAALGGIGDFPDTIEDRGPVVVMRRRLTTERVEPFRLRDAGPDLAKLRDLLHAWVRRHLEELRAARPRLPVEDRAADVWEPLVAVADLAGGTWPKRAREAAVAISGSEEPEDASMGERLLADLQKLFDDKAKPALPTAEILKELHGFEEAPWADYYGHALSARDLARLLRPFGIRSGNHRLGSATVV